MSKDKIKTRHKVAVDFDGTLTGRNAKGEKDPAALPPPLTGAADFLVKLMDAGKHVTIFTHRDASEVEQWLKLHGLTDLIPGGVTNVKPEASAYLDDRSVRFDGDYDKALKDLTKKKRVAEWWKQPASGL